MHKRYVVRLTEEERGQLEALVRRGRAQARKLLHGRILLMADANGDGWTDERIAEALEVSTATVARERRRFCEEGLQVALMPRKPSSPNRVNSARGNSSRDSHSRAWGVSSRSTTFLTVARNASCSSSNSPWPHSF